MISKTLYIWILAIKLKENLKIEIGRSITSLHKLIQIYNP